MTAAPPKCWTMKRCGPNTWRSDNFRRTAGVMSVRVRADPSATPVAAFPALATKKRVDFGGWDNFPAPARTGGESHEPDLSPVRRNGEERQRGRCALRCDVCAVAI